MPTTYTITHISDNPRTYEDKYGPKVSYKTTLKDSTGAEITAVEISQKPDTAPPQVGQQVEGEVETRTIDTRNGPMQVKKFKRAYSGGGGGGAYKQTHPVDAARMGRSHSQEMAVRVAIEAGWFKDFNPYEAEGQGYLKDLMFLTDWFQRDIERDPPRLGQPPRVKDITRTGATDVPADPEEFVHPPVDGEGLPFSGAPA